MHSVSHWRTRGAARKADTHLANAIGAADEQQGRDIRARDQEHRGDQPHHHHQRRRELLSRRRKAVARRLQQHDVTRVFHETSAVRFVQVGPSIERDRLRLVDRHAWFEPGDWMKPVKTRAFQRVRRQAFPAVQRQVDVNRIARLETGESRLSDAGNRISLPLDVNFATDHAGIGPECRSPQSLTDHRRIGDGVLLVTGIEQPPERRLNSERVEEISGHGHHILLLR